MLGLVGSQGVYPTTSVIHLRMSHLKKGGLVFGAPGVGASILSLEAW